MADKSSSGDKLLYCSFCGKSQHEVRKLIAGPSVFICDECIELCNDIIREEGTGSETARADRSKLPTPHEIRQISCGTGRSDFVPLAPCSVCVSSRMMSLHSSMHSSQMKTDGPAMSFLTSCWLLPQNEQ